MLPKLVVTDIDGVWTDGGMYYDNTTGNEWKKFNTSDSAGVLLARILGIEVAVITGENTEIVRRRCAKLSVDSVYMGVRNKLTVARTHCEEKGYDFSEVAFIGDDINDILLMREVGFRGAPASAPEYIKKEVDLVTKAVGGQGAFREFVETILIGEGKLDEAISAYLESIR